jgi:hypothetical protein
LRGNGCAQVAGEANDDALLGAGYGWRLNSTLQVRANLRSCDRVPQHQLGDGECRQRFMKRKLNSRERASAHL